MSFLKRLFRRSGPSPASKAGEDNSSNLPNRRRNLQNLAKAESESPVAQTDAPATEVKELPASQLPKAPAPKAPKKPTVEAERVKDSLSVVLRRQVPIRFGENARSWLGGLPQMPADIEWPHAKPKKPLHFMAQLDCASLPAELWEGLGPREGWLLLFVDMEALTDQIKRPFARVIHVHELGPEAQPPAGLYWARNNVADLSKVPNAPPGAQRKHFRKWPVDLVQKAADTSELTGGELYNAPESDQHIGPPYSVAIGRPMTWRGAYTILAGLGKGAMASNALLDYPEPYWSDYNEEYGKRRELIAQQTNGYHNPEFTKAAEQLHADMREERRNGWTQRSLSILDEQLALDSGKLADYRIKVAEALERGDEKWAKDNDHWIEYFEEKNAQHLQNKAYLEELFAKYPSEEALVAEIARVGHAHLQWIQFTQDWLRDLANHVGKKDLDAPIATADWDEIADQIASLKTSYWEKTYDTQVLRKVERGFLYNIDNAVREEVLDRYVSPPASVDGLDPDIVAALEPRLRHFETDHPHKLGGKIDSVYNDPLKKGHILLFQVASDAATGWIMGDLGLLYVSIDPADLRAGSFDNVRAWLEA